MTPRSRAAQRRRIILTATTVSGIGFVAAIATGHWHLAGAFALLLVIAWVAALIERRIRDNRRPLVSLVHLRRQRRDGEPRQWVPPKYRGWHHDDEKGN
jgi:hypothetical protein